MHYYQRATNTIMRPKITSCLLLLYLLIGAVSAAAQPKDNQGQFKKLQEHDKDSGGKTEEHDKSFDHDLFLGKEGSELFSGLRAEEAKTMLGNLFDTHIDADKDGKASQEELIRWMQHVAEEHVQNDVEANWNQMKKDSRDGGDALSWAEFTAYKLYSALPNVDSKHHEVVHRALQASNPAVIAKEMTVALEPVPKDASEDAKNQQESLVADLVRESRRWLAADGNKDGKLSKAELHQFLYPDEFEHMREVLVEESLGHTDKNKDGKVSVEEFIKEMWNPTKDSVEKEPEWVEEEKKHFKEVKDKDKDGFLDKKEYTEYLFSHHQEKSELYKREAQHLVTEADTDKDGAVSRKEMVDNLEVFAGSAATNYGSHIGLREDL